VDKAEEIVAVKTVVAKVVVLKTGVPQTVVEAQADAVVLDVRANPAVVATEAVRDVIHAAAEVARNESSHTVSSAKKKRNLSPRKWQKARSQCVPSVI
jgi:hypothetical protein